MKTFSVVSLFALYVLFVGAFTMWRDAEACQGMSLGRRMLFALSVSWKWWLLFSVALLVFDAAIFHSRGITRDFIVVGIAISMAAIFARRRSQASGRLQPKKDN